MLRLLNKADVDKLAAKLFREQRALRNVLCTCGPDVHGSHAGIGCPVDQLWSDCKEQALDEIADYVTEDGESCN